MPIFLPLLEHFGIDPLFFGLLIALNIQTSFLSPPVAMAPFYLKGVAPAGVSINEIFSGVMPFIFIVIFAMVLLYMFPRHRSLAAELPVRIGPHGKPLSRPNAAPPETSARPCGAGSRSR